MGPRPDTIYYCDLYAQCNQCINTLKSSQTVPNDIQYVHIYRLEYIRGSYTAYDESNTPILLPPTIQSIPALISIANTSANTVIGTKAILKYYNIESTHDTTNTKALYDTPDPAHSSLISKTPTRTITPENSREQSTTYNPTVPGVQYKDMNINSTGIESVKCISNGEYKKAELERNMKTLENKLKNQNLDF